MGWFTQNSTKWELEKSWISILGIGLPLGTPFLAMLYMGIRAKIKPLVYASLLYGVFFAFLLAASMVFSFSRSFWILMLIINFLLGPIIIAVYLQRFLRRVDLSKIIHIKWSVEYDYIDFMRRKQISEVLSVSSFVTRLQGWYSDIADTQVKKDIEKMIGLTKEITHNNEHVSNIFIERHAYSIENILQQYMQVERAKIRNKVMEDAQVKLQKTISLAVAAFEQELKNQRNFRNIDIEVQADIYLQDLKNKGLI